MTYFKRTNNIKEKTYNIKEKIIPVSTPHKNKNKNKKVKKDNDNKDLTLKQQRFIEAYLKDLNATNAAIKAGYSKKTAHVSGCVLLKNPKIQREVQIYREKEQDKAGISREWIIERYKRLIEFHIDEIYDNDGNMKPLDEIPKDILYAIQGIRSMKRTSTSTNKTTKELIVQDLKFHNKKDVLDSLARYLGMFEKEGEQGAGGGVNFNGPVQINVNVED
jgi:phage terminase small subunit